MCIIIDADLVHRVFTERPHPDFIPLLSWIIKGDGRIVIGGLNGRQIRRCVLAKNTIREWMRSGKAKVFDGVDEEQAFVEANLQLRSNDPQVIALARRSGARILCSCDRALHGDFSNTRLTGPPQGKIYQNARHEGVLVHSRGCQNR